MLQRGRLHQGFPGRREGTLILCLTLFAAVPAARADEPAKQPAKPSAKPQAVAKLITETGTILARAKPEGAWRVLEKGQAITSGNLLVGLPGAKLQSKNGAVQMSLLSDLANRSPLPIKESAITLHPADDVDLDFTLDRGRVDLINLKKDGPAKVRMRFRTRVWDMKLLEPGTRIAVEMYSLHPIGARFNPKPDDKDAPFTQLVLLALAGKVDRQCDKCFHALAAPPGPALFQWDSVHGDDPSTIRMEKLPEWADEENNDTPEAKRKRAKVESFRKMLVKEGVETTISNYLLSADADERRLGVFAAGALDKLEMLANMLNKAKHPDAWENTVVALRHWIGRKPGQAQVLYDRLMKLRHYSVGEARTTMQLLNGFTNRQEARPELYETLIDFLGHDKLALRGLANWHLQRLVPTADIPFDPTSGKEQAAKAQAAWRKLIPRGKLPPALRDTGGE